MTFEDFKKVLSFDEKPNKRLDTMSCIATFVVRAMRQVDYATFVNHEDEVREMVHEDLAHMIYNDMQRQFGGYTTDALRVAYRMGQHDGYYNVNDFEKVLKQVDGLKGQA